MRHGFVLGLSTAAALVLSCADAFRTSARLCKKRIHTRTLTRALSAVSVPAGALPQWVRYQYYGGGGGDDGARYIKLFPACTGLYDSSPAAFLGTRERLQSEHELVFPVPHSPELDQPLRAAVQRRLLSSAQVLIHMSRLINRDGGLWDSLPWEWSDNKLVKRDMYARLQGKNIEGNVGSAYMLLLQTTHQFLRAGVSALIIEIAGEGSAPGTVSLGGALVLERGCDSPVATREMNTEDLNLPDESHPSARTVICSMDEVVGFSAVTGLPIFVESEIFKAVRIPALVSVDNQGYIQLVAFSDTEAASKQPTYDASDGGVPPWSINADAFLAMSVEEKRKSLRAYGGVKLPRPREGSKKVDELLLPRLDEAVRRDILRRKALEAGDTDTATLLDDERSERQVLIERLEQFRKDGDEKAAEELEARLNLLTSIRADYTQDEGEYQKDLDADEWYAEMRRRTFGPPKE